MNEMSLSQEADYTVARSARVSNSFDPHGFFVVEHWRKGQKIGEYRFPNGITDQGKKNLLDIQFYTTTKISTWYLGMIDDGQTLAATDTYQNINEVGNGWDEFTDYTIGSGPPNATDRPAWTAGAASGAGTVTTTNASPVVFDITDTGTVAGLFLCGGIEAADTKNDHAASGILWATAAFTGGDVAVNNEDQLKVTYSVSA